MTIKQTLFLLAVTAFGFTACQTKQAEPAATVLLGDTTVDDTITYETAKRYVKNYEKRAGTVRPDSGGLLLPNSRCVWFSAKKLQKLLTKIKKENGDGIRFYMASYDNKYDETSNTKKPEKIYWGYNTLVMVSTKPLGDYHKDYYKDGTSNGSNAGFIVGGTPENRGEMCPPPRDCPSVGATLIP